MHARVATARVQPGKMDSLVSRLRDSVYPVYRQQQGFRGALALTDANTGKGISITLWDTEADMRAGEASTEQQRAALSDVRDSPVVEYYEVSIQA